MPPTRTTRSEPLDVRRPGPRLSDLFDQLFFPRIFASAAAAARPERVVAGALAVVLAGSVAVSLPRPSPNDPGFVGWLGEMIRLAWEGAFPSLLRLDMPELGQRARILLLETPSQAFAEAPFQASAVVVTVLLAWSVPGLYIARGVALELGRRVRARPVRVLGFLRLKAGAAVAALALIPALALLLLAVPTVLGLLLAVPGLDVIGAILHGLGLLAAIAAATLLLLWTASVWMAVPAVACDGADAFDACQRALGMFIARPLSILAHLLLASVQGVLVVGLVWIATGLGASMAKGALGLLTERGAMITGSAPPAVEQTGTHGAAAGIVMFWQALPLLITLAYAFSYAHAAGVAVYLNARQMVDGQEPDELWMPGEAAGVTAPAPSDGGPRGGGPGSPAPPGSSEDRPA